LMSEAPFVRACVHRHRVGRFDRGGGGNAANLRRVDFPVGPKAAQGCGDEVKSPVLYVCRVMETHFGRERTPPELQINC
jgi:hypothetical protein